MDCVFSYFWVINRAWFLVFFVFFVFVLAAPAIGRFDWLCSKDSTLFQYLGTYLVGSPRAMYSSYSVAAAVCSCVFPALALVAVGFRLRARAVQHSKLGADDWLIMVALVSIESYFDYITYDTRCDANCSCCPVGAGLFVLLHCSLWFISRKYRTGSEVCIGHWPLENGLLLIDGSTITPDEYTNYQRVSLYSYIYEGREAHPDYMK